MKTTTHKILNREDEILSGYAPMLSSGMLSMPMMSALVFVSFPFCVEEFRARKDREKNDLLALIEHPNLNKDFCVEEFRARKDREKKMLLALIEDPGSGTIEYEELLKVMSHKMLKCDPKDDIFKAFRFFDDDETDIDECTLPMGVGSITGQHHQGGPFKF